MFKNQNDGATLTRWVPYDGYIRHQNDHLSGRITDISVMGEWQVVGAGGTRPLRNVLGEALKGRFSFEARKYLFSFQSYVHFEEFFFVSRAFVRFGRQTFERWGFWFRRFLGALFRNSARSPGIFLRTPTTTSSNFENFLSFFKAQPVLLARHGWWSPGWTKHFGDDTSKIRRKTSLSGVGEIEQRRTSHRPRNWYESLAVNHGSNEKKKHKEVRVWLWSLNSSSSTNQRVLKNLFLRTNIATVLHFAVFSTWMNSCRSVRLQRGDSEEKQSSVTFPVLITDA